MQQPHPNDEVPARCPICGSTDVEQAPIIYIVVWCSQCGEIEYDPDTGEVIE